MALPRRAATTPLSPVARARLPLPRPIRRSASPSMATRNTKATRPSTSTCRASPAPPTTRRRRRAPTRTPTASNASSNLTFADGEAVGTFVNDDIVTPILSIDDVAYSDGDSGQTAYTFTVTASVAAPAGGYTVNYATSDDTATTGDNDYVSASGTLTFATGVSSQPVTVQVNGDRKFESNEAFKVTLSGATGGAQVSPTADVGTTEGDSGTKTLDFTVHLSAPALEGGVTVDIATADNTAVAASDYVAKSLSGQTIAAGNSDYTFSVTINGDTTLEADETFKVNVTSATGTSNATATGYGTILAACTVSLSVASPVDVNFTVNTANGSATAGSDYVAIVYGSGTITAGNLTTTVNVTINGDTTAEQNETYALNLSGITKAANTTASATGTITNDDNTLPIMQLQGDGVATPIASTLVFSTRGIVTARKASGSGYFIQDPVGDGNPATSDGIFVFGPGSAGAVGDDVTIVAKVTEFSGSTE